MHSQSQLLKSTRKDGSKLNPDHIVSIKLYIELLYKKVTKISIHQLI